MSMYARYIKRPQDFFFATIALILLIPVMTVTAFLIRKKLGGPVGQCLISSRNGERDRDIIKLCS